MTDIIPFRRRVERNSAPPDQDPRCLACGSTATPTPPEAEKLASMRDELLQDDWAYWHDDPAVLFLNRLIGETYQPWRPEGV